jgi:hypothetical protein
VVDVRRIAGVLEVADAVREIVEHGGGSVSGVRPDAVRFLATFINNHTTLRAKAKRPELYHVLVRGNTILGKRALLAETFDDSTVQLEGIRGPEGPCLMARILAPTAATPWCTQEWIACAPTACGWTAHTAGWCTPTCRPGGPSPIALIPPGCSTPESSPATETEK